MDIVKLKIDTLKKVNAVSTLVKDLYKQVGEVHDKEKDINPVPGYVGEGGFENRRKDTMKALYENNMLDVAKVSSGVAALCDSYDKVRNSDSNNHLSQDIFNAADNVFKASLERTTLTLVKSATNSVAADADFGVINKDNTRILKSKFKNNLEAQVKKIAELPAAKLDAKALSPHLWERLDKVSEVMSQPLAAAGEMVNEAIAKNASDVGKEAALEQQNRSWQALQHARDSQNLAETFANAYGNETLYKGSKPNASSTEKRELNAMDKLMSETLADAIENRTNHLRNFAKGPERGGNERV